MAQDFQGANEQKVVAAMLERWTFLNTQRRAKMWLWQEARLNWSRKFGESWGEIMDNRSHRYLPEAYQAVETAVATMLQTVMPNDRFFKPVGRTKLAQESAASLEAKMRWDNYRMGHRKTFKSFLKKACVDGNVPWTYKWHTEKAVIADEEVLKQKQEIEASGLEVEIDDPAGLGIPTQEISTFEGGRLIVGDIFNFVKDRHPDDPRFSFRVYRSAQTLEYIQDAWGKLVDINGKPIYRNLENLTATQGPYEVSDALRRAIDQSIGYTNLPEDKVELLTVCGDLAVPGEGFFHNFFAVIGNRRELLRFSANPWAHGLPPWQMFTLIEDPNDPYGYGTGLIEPSLGLFDLINVRANQTVDANSLAIMPPMGVVADGISDVRNNVWGPGEQLYMRAAGNISPMAVSKDALQLGLQEIQFYKSEIAGATGVAAGISTATSDASATEVAGVQRTASAVQNELAQQVKHNGLIPMLRMHASMNQQLMDANNSVMVRLFVDESGVMRDPATGETLQSGIHWAEVSASDIQGEFDYEIIGADSIAQTMVQQQNQMNFINAARQDPVFQRLVDMSKFYTVSMEKLGFTDAWRFMRNEQELAAYDQQQTFSASMGQPGGPSGAAQSPGTPPGNGVPSTPGNAGSGGSPARTPYPQQLAGPTRHG